MAEIYVTSTADSGAGSLRQAIADAQDGDVILFDSDVFPAGETTSIFLSSSFYFSNKTISIYGGFTDGNGGYTSGATITRYVVREVDGVETEVVVDEEHPAIDGETVLLHVTARIRLDAQNSTGYFYVYRASLNFAGIEFVNFNKSGTGNNGGVLYYSENSVNNVVDCSFKNCHVGSYGAAIFSTANSVTTITHCEFTNCSALNGGVLYSYITSINTLNDCTITDCSATSGGGGVYSTRESQNTLTDCVFDSCSAFDGGAIYSMSSSQNTLNACTITNCSATNGGAAYSTNSTTNTLINCTLNNNASTTLGRHGFVIGQTSILTATSCNIDAVYMGASSTLSIDGITLINAITTTAATITIADGAALTLTGTATIGAAKFTSDGRGYLAVAPGIDTSAATLTGVVLCAYGANVSNFAEVDGVLEWSAANPTTTVLIERADGDSWSTVTQTAGESLTLYLPPSDTVRLFDGVQFFVAQAPSQRTYYYIGGSEGSFTSAADWSLRRGGAAITEPPVVAGQRFIVGDISSGE